MAYRFGGDDDRAVVNCLIVMDVGNATNLAIIDSIAANDVQRIVPATPNQRRTIGQHEIEFGRLVRARLFAEPCQPGNRFRHEVDDFA